MIINKPISLGNLLDMTKQENKSILGAKSIRKIGKNSW